MRAMYDGLEKIASRYSNTERSILNDLEGKEADGGAAYFEDACAAYDGKKRRLITIQKMAAMAQIKMI